MLKKRYTALIVVMALVVGVIILSFSLSVLADSWRTSGREGSQNAQLTAEDAEDIALANAGYTRGEVAFKPTEFDFEKGRSVWEVEFYHENTEYDFEIDANTGEILRKEQEIERKPIKPTPAPEPTPKPAPEPKTEPKTEPTPEPEKPSAPTELSEERALEIALADAGLTADVISRLKIEKDRDDGVWIYEIEFDHGYTEYEYEIRVSDGKILERDIDLD